MATNPIKPLEMYDLLHSTALLLGEGSLKVLLKDFGTREEYAADLKQKGLL